MYWKVTYFEIDSETKKPSWKSLFFPNDYTYFELSDYLRDNQIFNYKIDVVSKDDVSNENIINK
jgi:hypothetical protein